MELSISRLKEKLNSPLPIVIVTHSNPDGDAMGSSLGLGNYLRAKGHSVIVVTPNEFPDFLGWLPGQEMVKIFSKNKASATEVLAAAKVIFCLDFNTLGRIGEVGEEVKRSSAFKVMIDHHEQPDSFPDLLFHDTKACSTAQLVFELIESCGDKELISKECGICIYTGIMTDTASFRFPSTTAHTHQIVAFLKEIGVETYKAHEGVYDSNTYDRLRLIGFALSEKMKILKDVKAAYISLTKEELKRFENRTGDTEGLVNYCLSIQGIKVAAFFMEKENEIKVSLRSKGMFDVNKLSRAHFNGGGHKNAAGGSLKMNMTEAIRHFEKVMEENKNELK